MDERHVVLAELEGARERAAGLLRAKLDAVAAQIREAAARAAGDLEVVVPPDLEILLPLAPAARLIEAQTPPVPPPTIAMDTLRRLDAGRAQSEVLKEFLAQLEGFCGPRAILVFREGEVAGWNSIGLPDDAAFRGWHGRLTDSAAFAAVAEGTPVVTETGSDALLAGLLGGARLRALLVPMSLRGKVVGASLAVEGDGQLAVDVVQIMTYLTGLLLETLAVRPLVPTPAIGEPISMVPAGMPEPEDGAGLLAQAEVPVEVGAPAPEVVVPGEAVAAEAAVDRGIAAEVPVPLPEVSLRTPEDQQKHGEAHRFARLLVSEIRLYNEQAVQEGRASRDIYQRLKEDIDRSREMYEQRVPADVRASSNYFFEELVRILADGDPDALGL